MNTENSHVPEYREIIEELAQQRTNQRIPNGMPQHAAVLIETMFRNSIAEMRIFSMECSPNIFGRPEVIEAACDFLSKPYSKLRIIVQKKQEPQWALEHPLLKTFKELEELHGEVKVVNATGAYADADASHFAVMDNDGFRYEFDHDNCKAVANFNEPVIAKRLLSSFDSAFGIAIQNSNPLYQL